MISDLIIGRQSNLWFTLYVIYFVKQAWGCTNCMYKINLSRLQKFVLLIMVCDLRIERPLIM